MNDSNVAEMVKDTASATQSVKEAVNMSGDIAGVMLTYIAMGTAIVGVEVVKVTMTEAIDTLMDTTKFVGIG